MSDKHPWRDEELLRQKYWVEHKSIADIADEWGCGTSTIFDWLNRHEIERRSVGGTEKDAPYKQRANLIKEYVEKQKTTYELAEKWEVDASTIQRWLKRHDIPRRYNTLSLKTNHNGYEIIRVSVDSNDYYVRIHRLLAIAEGKLEPNELFDSDVDIHHKNGIYWDNRPDNIKCLKHADHIRQHQLSR